MASSEFLTATRRSDHKGMVLGTCMVGNGFGASSRSRLYDARALIGGRRFRVKVMTEGWHAQVAGRGRTANPYLHELRVAGALGSQLVIKHLEVGTTPAREHFLVTEPASRQTLRDLLTSSGPLGLPEALGILASVGAIVDGVHGLGFLNLDLRPENLVVDSSDAEAGLAARLIDLEGLYLEGEGSVSRASLPFEPSPLYLSPEQASGADLTPRCDIFAMGLLLYELLSGKSAVPGSVDQPDAIVAWLTGDDRIPQKRLRDLVRNIPDEADMLIGKCLDRNPTARPASAEQVLRGMHHVLKVFKQTHREALIPDGLWGRLQR